MYSLFSAYPWSSSFTQFATWLLNLYCTFHVHRNFTCITLHIVNYLLWYLITVHCWWWFWSLFVLDCGFMYFKFPVGVLYVWVITLSLMCLQLRLLHVTGEWLYSVERLLWFQLTCISSYMETLEFIINIKVSWDVAVCRLVYQYQLICCNMSKDGCLSTALSAKPRLIYHIWTLPKEILHWTLNAFQTCLIYNLLHLHINKRNLNF